MAALQKLLAITLLALLVQPFVQLHLAWNTTSVANLPACCRRNGKHHCVRSAAESRRLSSHAPQFQAPDEKCPYREAMIAQVIHGKKLLPSAGQAIFAGLASHTAIAAQTESKLRISYNRSRQKRGPPALFL